MNRILIAAIFFSFGLSKAQVFNIIVAKEGEGANRTVQSAINQIPSYSTQPYRVFIKNGVYNEKVSLPASKTNVSLIGESVDGVIITFDDYAGKDGITTAASYTFLAEGNDLYLENITFRNSAGDVGQALAIRTTGERQIFKNCRFKGFQDTYYAHKNRQYNLNCYIEGATDFIFGDATAVFENCIINCLPGGQYISAPADTKLTSLKNDNSTLYHGLLFISSDITSADEVPAESYYLGRPWQPNSSSVYINCTLGDHIKPQGWSVWNDNNHLSGFYGEYHSRDKNGYLVDTSLRVDWSHQLDSLDVINYYSLTRFFKKNDQEWNPVPRTVSLDPPSVSGDGNKINWSGVPGAIGYAVLMNNSVIGFSDTTFFTDTISDNVTSRIYTVKSITVNGNLSDPSNGYIVLPSAVFIEKEVAFQFTVADNYLVSSVPVNICIYDLSGKFILYKENVQNLTLTGFKRGFYIVKAENGSGAIIIKKIVL